MKAPLPRMAIGFVAAALSVLTFHQITVWVLSLIGMVPPGAAYNLAGVPPWGVPRVLNLCFWGGLYGAVYGLLWPGFTKPAWLSGLITGIIAGLVGLFVVAAIKGLPLAGGWSIQAIARSLIINGAWGVGLGLFGSLLLPEREPEGYRIPVRH